MGWLNRELAVTHHGARRHASELVPLLRGDGAVAARPDPAALADLARLARLRWHAERRALVLEAELVRLRERTVAAEAALVVAGEEAADAAARVRAGHAADHAAWTAETAAEAAAWQARVAAAEAALQSARAQLGTRRVQAGLRAGALLDRTRRRR